MKKEKRGKKKSVNDRIDGVKSMIFVIIMIE